jgi:hypothetical protein
MDTTVGTTLGRMLFFHCFLKLFANLLSSVDSRLSRQAYQNTTHWSLGSGHYALCKTSYRSWSVSRISPACSVELKIRTSFLIFGSISPFIKTSQHATNKGQETAPEVAVAEWSGRHCYVLQHAVFPSPSVRASVSCRRSFKFNVNVNVND